MNRNTNKNASLNEAFIHSLSHDGRGIATISNITTFIDGALPQEIVTYKTIKKRRQYHEAEVLEILHRASERTAPPCRHFGTCGGCRLQHMSIENQIQLKENTLLEQLKHFGKVKPEIILPALDALSTGYRRKARLGAKFVSKKEKVFVGFREKASHYLADLTHCVVLHPKIGERLIELNRLIASLEACQQIPQIEVAMGDEEAALVFRHMATLTNLDKDKLQDFGKTNGFHMYLQPNPPQALEKLWPLDAHHRLSYTLPDDQLEFLFHPLDFTQINLEMNRNMVHQALTLLDLASHETVLDLFCGIGNFTLPIARRAKQVIGVEGSSDMVKRGQENAKHNHLNNVTFYAANLEKISLEAPWLRLDYDKIVLDPPRTGAKEILPFISKLGAKKILYVSCNPATLARDAGELVHNYKYRLQVIGTMNMFPHTAHIEAMALFEKI